MLPKKFRLPAEYFRKQYQKGKKTRGRYGMFVVSENEIANPRFGFVVSKKIGNSVKRHRMTRLLRAISMDLVKEKSLEGFSFQYIAIKFCDDYKTLKEEFTKQLDNCLQNLQGEKNNIVFN